MRDKALDISHNHPDVGFEGHSSWEPVSTGSFSFCDARTRLLLRTQQVPAPQPGVQWKKEAVKRKSNEQNE